MPLTDLEIESLFKFTQKKFVHYYDLQVELVDHLASSIEDEIDENPTLSFEQALQKVYKRFGIFGFAKVVQEREEALRKNNNRIWWRAVKEFFTIPKVALTAALFFSVLLIGQMLLPEAKLIILFLFWVFIKCIDIREHRISNKIKIKNLLLTQNTSFFSFSGIWFPYTFFLREGLPLENNYVFAIAIVVVFIFESAVIQVNKEVRKKAMELYPEAFVLA